ncbi:hypothetical protein ACX818_001454 [Acinetobacter baumannii]
MAKLHGNEITAVIFGRLNKIPQRVIAESLGCSADTVRRIERTNKDRMEMFVENEDGTYSLADKSKVLFVKGEFVFNKITITGDVEDGVIVANELYAHNDGDDEVENDPFDAETFNDWYFNDDDVGIIKDFKVGKIFTVKDNKHISTDVGYVSNSDLPDFDGKPYVRGYLPGTLEETTISPVEDFPEIEATWTASEKFISIVVGRKVINADSSHPQFKEAQQALIDGNIAAAIQIINVETAIERYVNGNVEIKDGRLYYKGFEIRTGLTNRIIKSMQDGENFEFYIPFLENVMMNPSYKAVDRLFDFLQANDIEITEDGYFIAWKKVREDFMDIYTGTMDNSPGKVVSMPRNLVNENDHETCSVGLHVCSKSYLTHYGTGTADKVVKVKVHPKDVVSIPVDYNNAKMRTCEYEVLSEA